MATTKIYVPAGLKIGTTYLPHCGEQSIDQGLDELTVFPSGDWAPNMTGSKTWSPSFGIESHDVAAALDLCDLNYVAKSCLGLDVRVFERKIVNQAFQSAVADAVHEVFQLNLNALLLWEQLQASQADEATKLSLKLIATSPAGAAPLIALGPTAIDAPGAQNEPFTLGPLKLNGAFIEGISQWSWANNLKQEKISSDGEPTPSFIAITQLKPVITFDSTDVHTMCALDPDGSPITALTCFLHRRRSSKTVWASDQSKHVKLYTPTISGGIGSVGTLKWTKVGGSPAKVSCQISLHRNSPTSALFLYAKDVQIA